MVPGLFHTVHWEDENSSCRFGKPVDGKEWREGRIKLNDFN
jgi:hypothetical protein